MIDDKQAYESSTKLEPRVQSTVVSASAASAASTSFASLASSLGIDKDFDLSESTELGMSSVFVAGFSFLTLVAVDGEFVIDTMHTRFRKDLIRSRV